MHNSETNSAHSANQTTNTPASCNVVTRAKASRKIDAAVITQMAKAVATMLTESEAARRCGIEPRHWFEWKSRAGRAGKFAALLEEFRANKIAGLLDRVQKSADGIDVKFPDFRAALALLKFQDRARFGDSPTVENNHTNMIILPGDSERIKQLCAVFAAPALPPGQGQAKLPAGTTDQPADQPIEA